MRRPDVYECDNCGREVRYTELFYIRVWQKVSGIQMQLIGKEKEVCEDCARPVFDIVRIR